MGLFNFNFGLGIGFILVIDLAFAYHIIRTGRSPCSSSPRPVR